MSERAGFWVTVSRGSPCSGCGRPDWCSRLGDGSSWICRRPNSAAGADGTLRRDRNGSEYLLHLSAGSNSVPTPWVQRSRIALATPQAASTQELHFVYSYLLEQLSLDASCLGNLVDRGLEIQEIELRRYRTLPQSPSRRASICADLVGAFGTDTMAKIPGFYRNNLSNSGKDILVMSSVFGLIIPVRDYNGLVVALKVRTMPDMNQNNNKVLPKYLYFSSKSNGGPGPGAHVHVPLFGNALKIEDTIRVTEGELKGDIATSITGTLTISVPGVTSWRLALPVVAQFGAATVLVAFDADADTNHTVRSARTSLVDALLSDGYDVEIEKWN